MKITLIKELKLSNLLSHYEHYEKAFYFFPSKAQGIVVGVYIPTFKRFVTIPTAAVTLLSANRCNYKNAKVYWKNKDPQLKSAKVVGDVFQNKRKDTFSHFENLTKTFVETFKINMAISGILLSHTLQSASQFSVRGYGKGTKDLI